MLDYIRIACAVPPVKVGDTVKNAADICRYIEKADEANADLVVFPELSLTGYTCQDLFFRIPCMKVSRMACGRSWNAPRLIRS